MAGASYSIKKNRIQKGWYPGFVLEEDGTLSANKNESVHILYLRAVDSGRSDASWGRLRFQAFCPENMVFYVYAAAFNEESFYRQEQPVRIEDFLCDCRESHMIKRQFMRQAGFRKFINQKDILLYDLHGRYLYLVMEVVGEGVFSMTGMRVDQQGDHFMNTFPEIYREEGSFFHRYLSVFSSIYQDFQENMEDLPKLLDLDCCPVQLLPVYGKWLGLDTGDDFLEERILRTLVKEAYELNRIKGTRKALERIAEIVLEKEVQILERNVMGSYILQEEQELMNRLYGCSVYDVTILVPDLLSEVKKNQLLFLLDQFRPIRSSLHVVCLKQNSVLDSYSYLDMNARIPCQGEGSLDRERELDGGFCLQ